MSNGHSISDQAGNILHVDEAVADLLQRPVREMVGRSYLDITHPADRPRNKAQVGRLVTNGPPSIIRKRYLRADGSVVWADVNVVRLQRGSDSGRLVGKLSWSRADAPETAPDELWRAAREISAEIHMRRMALGDDLFADHAWLILLETYLAEAEGRPMDTASAAGTTAIPLPTVARWIKALQARQLIELHAVDETRFQLTGMGAHSVETLVAAHVRG